MYVGLSRFYTHNASNFDYFLFFWAGVVLIHSRPNSVATGTPRAVMVRSSIAATVVLAVVILHLFQELCI